MQFASPSASGLGSDKYLRQRASSVRADANEYVHKM